MRILITGANRGIGLEFVRQYAPLGHEVLATCRNPHDAVELAELCVRHPNVEILELDVVNADSVRECAEQASVKGLDLLLNNAGHYGRSTGDLDTVDPLDWMQIFEVNCIGPLQVTKALLPALMRGTAPKVVGVSSVKGSVTRNHMGASYQYRSSKSAFNAVLRSLAVDLKPRGINVFALSPGWVDQGEDVTGGLSFDDRLRKARKFVAEFGGSSARVSLEESVSLMTALIERLADTDSGGFFDHLGQPLPW